MKRIKKCLAGIASVLLLTSCTSKATYEGFVFPNQGGSTLTPVEEYKRTLELEDVCTEEPTLSTYSSDDGLCIIEKKEHYYSVTLDLEKGDHYKAGAAYAEAILKTSSDFAENFEPYLFENITMAFSEVNEESYKSLTERVTALKDSLEEEYRLEVEGFADRISGGVHGYEKDGIISYEEALTLQMVPDALRGTSCSAVSLDGSRTVSGKRISARILEWLTGSSDQLSSILKPGFPYVDELSRKFNESVLLSTVRNGKRVLLYEVHANHELQVRAKQESTVYRTTSGVVQLAYFDRQRLDDFIKIAGLPGAEWPGVRTREQMEDAFVKIRRDGILVTLNKNHVVGLAAPLFQNGVVIAAIGIYLPDIRINDRIQASMEASLKKTAAAISALL